MPYRVCEKCGGKHLSTNSPICGACRKKGSKRPCSIDGCETLIGEGSVTCLMHRHLQKNITYGNCRECGVELPKPSVRGVCDACYDSVMVLCACGCGRYRRKYGERGQVFQFISGHNDVWETNRRPTKRCDVCGNEFNAASPRQRLCGIECRTEWLRLNPPRERKRVLVHCAECGKAIYRAPYQVTGSDYACSKKCRYLIVSRKNSGPKSDAKKLALRRDGGRCAICGFNVVVEVHHIQPRKRNGGGGTNELDNLITLCPNHHTMADRGLLNDEELKEYIRRMA